MCIKSENLFVSQFAAFMVILTLDSTHISITSSVVYIGRGSDFAHMRTRSPMMQCRNTLVGVRTLNCNSTVNCLFQKELSTNVVVSNVFS